MCSHVNSLCIYGHLKVDKLLLSHDADVNHAKVCDDTSIMRRVPRVLIKRPTNKSNQNNFIPDGLPRLIFVTTRKIKAGDQILFDYNDKKSDLSWMKK